MDVWMWVGNKGASIVLLRGTVSYWQDSGCGMSSISAYLAWYTWVAGGYAETFWTSCQATRCQASEVSEVHTDRPVTLNTNLSFTEGELIFTSVSCIPVACSSYVVQTTVPATSESTYMKTFLSKKKKLPIYQSAWSHIQFTFIIRVEVHPTTRDGGP
jgi:hypothetical protein